MARSNAEIEERCGITGPTLQKCHDGTPKRLVDPRPTTSPNHIPVQFSAILLNVVIYDSEQFLHILACMKVSNAGLLLVRTNLRQRSLVVDEQSAAKNS